MTDSSVHPDEMFDDDPTLAAFARDLRAAADASPPPVVGASLAAVLEGREVPPVTTASPVLPRPRRSARVRWVVGSAVFGMTIGGLGVAGALPGPVQRQVSRVGNVVGVELPEGGHDEPDPTTTPSSTTVVPGTDPARPAPLDTTEGDDDLGDLGDDELEAPGEGNEHRSDQGDEHGRDGTEGRGNGGEEPGESQPRIVSRGERANAFGRGPSGSEESTTPRN